MIECQRGAAQYAARYAFMVLDADRDGLISVDELLRFELFASYGQTVVERIHSHFEYTSGCHGHLNVEDFCRLSAMVGWCVYSVTCYHATLSFTHTRSCVRDSAKVDSACLTRELERRTVSNS